MKTAITNNTSEKKISVLEQYIRENMYQEGQVGAFVLLTLAKNEKIRGKMLSILKDEIKEVFSMDFKPDPDNDSGTVLSFRWIAFLNGICANKII